MKKYLATIKLKVPNQAGVNILYKINPTDEEYRSLELSEESASYTKGEDRYKQEITEEEFNALRKVEQFEKLFQTQYIEVFQIDAKNEKPPTTSVDNANTKEINQTSTTENIGINTQEASTSNINIV